MDLSGTVETPFGAVSKKTLLIGGVGAGIVGVMLWRSHQATVAKQKSVAAAGQSEIDPATGYPFGSAEDAAALAAQGSYLSPGGGGTGGGSFTPTNPDNIVTNAQWSQKVLAYWDANSLGDLSIMSAALGVYLAGGVPTANQISLIHQAEAIAGIPPVEGNGGYPPHINTSNTPPPVTTPPPPVTGPPPPAPGRGDPNSGTHDEYHGWFTVKAGWKVSQWVRDIISHSNGNRNATYEYIDALNGGAVGRNVNWTINGHPAGTEETTFKRQETYKVRTTT